jgi:hypothetical protein
MGSIPTVVADDDDDDNDNNNNKAIKVTKYVHIVTTYRRRE